MAQKHIVQLIDDLDGGPADETIRFALEGFAYEIDLSERNADKLRQALAVYVENARRVTRPVRSGGARRGHGARSDREQTQAIREWARKNGLKIGEKGRIPGSIVEAYNSAN